MNYFRKKINSVLVSLLTLIIAFSGYTCLFINPVSGASANPQWVEVAAGRSHALVIDEEGNVWSLGTNNFQQLGDGTKETRWKPNMVYHYKEHGKAVSVAAGDKQSLLLTENGEVYVWGYDQSDKRLQLTEKVRSIYAGGDYCIAVLYNGEALIWSSLLSPIKIKDETGYNSMKNIKEVAVGSNDFIIVLENNGRVYQLSPYDKKVVPVKVSVSSEQNNVSESSGTGKGKNLPDTDENGGSESSNPGEETEDPDISSPETTPTLTPTPTLPPEPKYLKDIVSVTAGESFGLALNSENKVFGWGKSSYKVLGPDLGPADYLENAKELTHISTPLDSMHAGDDHVIGLSGSGLIYGWGSWLNMRQGPGKKHEGFGSLNLQYKTPEGTIGAISNLKTYAPGRNFNIAMDNSSGVFIWGNDREPELLEFTQNFKKHEEIQYEIIGLSDKSISIRWNPDEFYKSLITGFSLKAVMLNGTVESTPIVETDASQITLLNLQRETEYLLIFQAHGKSGLIEETELEVVKTLKPDEITPTTEPTPDETSSEAESSGIISDASSALTSDNGEEPNDKKLSDIFAMLLIGLVVIVIIGALAGMIYLWRKIEKNNLPPPIKPVRIRDNYPDDYEYDDDDNDDEISGFTDIRDNETDENEETAGTEEGDIPPLSWHDVGTDTDETSKTDLTDEEDSSDAPYNEKSSSWRESRDEHRDENREEKRLSASDTRETGIIGEGAGSETGKSGSTGLHSASADNGKSSGESASPDEKDESIDISGKGKRQIYFDDDDDFIIRRPGEPK